MENKTSKESFLANALENKFIIICILILLSNIPLGMVKNMINSRKDLFDSTMKEISTSWGGEQTIVAPILNIPVEFTDTKTVFNENKNITETKLETYRKIYSILPENLNINAVINPEIRNRGIYNVLVHSTKIKITGNFEKLDIKNIEQNGKILWDKAWLSIGIDPSSIRGDIKVDFGNKNIPNINSGTGYKHSKGISANLDINDKNTEKVFDIQLQFNGSSDISFAPLGKKNNFEVSSNWAHPIFKEMFRPDSINISDNGFNAKWSIPYLARDYPQMMVDYDNMLNINNYLASVGLFDTMPIYKESSRLIKYGIMFVSLTFIMMFLFEKKIKKSLHYIQYIVVATAISLFFLTVLSFSEYMSFLSAYTIASIFIISIISLYLYAALKSKRLAGIGASIMAVLYGILYLMLSETDYALLVGTIILLGTISIVMWETRDINIDQNKSLSN